MEVFSFREIPCPLSEVENANQDVIVNYFRLQVIIGYFII